MSYRGMPDIEPVEIDFDKLREANREFEFVTASFNLLREVTGYCGVAACLLPEGRNGWDADHAILCGLIARLAKLLHGVLGYGAEDRRELVTILTRCAFETMVNIRFIIRNFNPDVISSYRRYSLRHERQLRDEILKNIKDRGDAALPIERRMLASIDRAFAHAGVTPEEVDPSDRAHWGGRSIYRKAVDVDLQSPYLSLFGGGSHAVHGNWQDLLDYHLDEHEGLYRGNPDFHRSRPQLFEAVGVIAIGTLLEYFEFFDKNFPASVRKRLEALQESLMRVLHEHEQYLRRKLPKYEIEPLAEGGS